MKKILLSLIVLATFAACKKDDRACYTCTQKVTWYYNGLGTTQTDTTRYCDKTEDEARQIEDVALSGTVGNKTYHPKTCKKD